MRQLLAAVLVVPFVASAMPALGADASAQGSPDVQNSSSAQNSPTDCIDVRIGADRAPNLDCINSQLRRQAARAAEAKLPNAPIDSGSASNIVGTANRAVAEEKMGDAFGRSATPQRPAKVYIDPLIAPAVPR